MKTNKIVCLLALGLLCGSVAAQQSEPTRSGFQGLWQERSGHSLHLTYGFFVDTWFVQHAKNSLPFRFDLDYQYDIPWKFKRTNFFAEAGLAYMWANSEERRSTAIENQVDCQTSHRESLRLGIGLKVHCTDWLYLSFGGGLNAGLAQAERETKAYPLSPSMIYESNLLYTQSMWQFNWGAYSAAGIVAQIKQFSISLGYRADHWVNPNFRFNAASRQSGHTDWFVTLGVGYHF